MIILIIIASVLGYSLNTANKNISSLDNTIKAKNEEITSMSNVIKKQSDQIISITATLNQTEEGKKLLE